MPTLPLGDENLPNTLMENLKKLLDQKPMTDIESSDDDEEYVEYIYKPRKYFLVGLCNVSAHKHARHTNTLIYSKTNDDGPKCNILYACLSTALQM